MVIISASTKMYSVLRGSAVTVNLYSNFRRCSNLDLSMLITKRFIQSSRYSFANENVQKQLTLHTFEKIDKKEKEAFLDVLHTYEITEPTRRGHVEFVYAAMNYMDEFGVNEDLETYKKLIDIFPKGRFIASSPLTADLMHYPKQQQCIIDLLEKMETNGVIPDYETQELLLNIFGQFGIPLRKFWRMMYWMPKFKNLNPWPTPRPVPQDPMELAKLAVAKMTSVDVQSRITIFKTEEVEDSIDKTWIVSGMSPEQESLLKKHPKNVACYVEGPFRIWVAHMAVDYFILRADAKPPIKYDFDEDDITNIKVAFWDNPTALVSEIRSVHEQEDATIYSVCATGTSSKDSLLSWIRCLQRKNPVLEKIPILFTLMRKVEDQQVITDGKSKEDVSASEGIRKIEDN